MRRGLAYVLVVCGLILLFSNATIAEAEGYSLNMDLDIHDAYYLNLETDKSTIENDIITYFSIELKIVDEEDDEEEDEQDDENEDYEFVYPSIRSTETKVFLIYLTVKLQLPSKHTFEYELKISAKLGLNEYGIYFYNHATESGWYIVSISSYYQKASIYAYDEFVFDPPGGTDGGEPPSIQIFMS